MLSWVVAGLIVGLLAKFIIPGKEREGIISTLAAGVIGALGGGCLGSSLGLGTITGFNLGSLLLAIGGAALISILYRFTKR